MSNRSKGPFWLQVAIILGAIGIVVLSVLLTGCAPVIDRVVQDATEGIAEQAAYVPIPGDDAAPQLELLMNAARNLDIQVVDEPPAPVCRPVFAEDGETLLDVQCSGAPEGVFWAAERVIQLATHLDTNARLEVLSHELSHAFQPRTLSRVEAEVFAELTGVEVQRLLGYTAGAKTSGKYLSGFKQALYIAKTHRKDIEAAAKEIVAKAEQTDGSK